MGIIKKIVVASRNTTTYRVGLLQAKAYRILKQKTDEALKHVDISSIDWAFLGLLLDNADGLNSKQIALEIGIKAPFVTELADDLKQKGFIKVNDHPEDGRANIVCLTDKGISFVESTEKSIRNQMRGLVKDVPAKDILSYLAVLQAIIDNGTAQS